MRAFLLSVGRGVTAAVGRPVGFGGEERVAVAHGLGDVDQSATRSSRVIAQEVEGLLLRDLVALHENALGAFGHRAPGECAFEVVVLGKAAQDDAQRAFQLVDVIVGEVGENAAFGRFLDEGRVLSDQQYDDRAGGLLHDPLDQLQGVGGVVAEADQRDIGPRLGGQRGDGAHVGGRDDDLVTERCDDAPHPLYALFAFVGDEDPELLVGAFAHRVLRTRF